MQLRMLARRSTGRFTVLGDIAQAAGPVAYRSWDELLPYLGGEAHVEELRLAYRVPRDVLELALPLLAAAALAAIALRVVQTRSLWLPRRHLPGAPVVPARRGSRAVLDQLAAIVVAGVCVGWLWSTAPALATLMQSPRTAGLAIAALLATLAIAVIALGVLDALVRKLQLDAALMMTRDEKREDDRIAAADPRWRAQRLAVLRGPAPQDAVARAAVVVLGDDVAVAIAWDPTRQPVPTRVASGRRARSTQLVALARRYGVPVHRDARLAARLASAASGDGPVAAGEWPALAELVAAVRHR
jgi:type III secretion system FlhB-like substrate exporter